MPPVVRAPPPPGGGLKHLPVSLLCPTLLLLGKHHLTACPCTSECSKKQSLFCCKAASFGGLRKPQVLPTCFHSWSQVYSLCLGPVGVWSHLCCSHPCPPRALAGARQPGPPGSAPTADPPPPAACQQVPETRVHPPRNLRSASTSPGTLHTVFISMGTTSGSCSFTSCTLQGQCRRHPP